VHCRHNFHGEESSFACGRTGIRFALVLFIIAEMNQYSNKTSEKVEKTLHEMNEGKLRSGGSGKKVKSRKQAIAIGLSEARAAGAKAPPKKRSKNKSPK
jgi:hypothetical protein